MSGLKEVLGLCGSPRRKAASSAAVVTELKNRGVQAHLQMPNFEFIKSIYPLDKPDKQKDNLGSCLE